MQEGEGYFIEFKESLSGVDKEMVAFANASGGKILLGVADSGKIKGLSITNVLKSQVQDIANNCRPKIKIFLEQVESVLVVDVREGDGKPYECSSGFYKRLGANSQKITRNEIISLLKSEGKVRFDELFESKFSYPKDFDKAKLIDFLKRAQISSGIPSKDALASLGVVQKQEGRICFNNTGVLFFAKEPQRFVPWSVFTVALFKDKDGVDIIDRKEITGSLFEIVDKVIDFVRLYAKVAYRITGKPAREEIYEYPLEAVREAVINSVMHKDYFEHGHNNILKFLPDRIQIENIWIKPKNFILGRTIFRRNHFIADMLNRINFGEKMGSGMRRMRNICKEENAPYPKIDYTDTHFYIVFKQSREYLKMAGMVKNSAETDRKGLVDRLVDRLVENQRKILQFMQKNPYISKRELSQKIKISTTAIDKNIGILKRKGLIKRIGPAKGGHWEILSG